MNDERQNMKVRNTGMRILGGGLSQHLTCIANTMLNAADFAFFINRKQDFDVTDCGTHPDGMYLGIVVLPRV